MTVILMLAMFAIFLTIDYLRKGKEAAQTADARQEATAASPRLMPTIVAGFDVPENRHYHQGHTWALQESLTLVRVGIDDFGARLVGRVDEIVLPKRGQWRIVRVSPGAMALLWSSSLALINSSLRRQRPCAAQCHEPEHKASE